MTATAKSGVRSELRHGKRLPCLSSGLTFMLISLILFCAPLAADNCGDSERFDINDNGTVTDIDAGLTWMRCSLGQHWDGNTCQGRPWSLSWPEARRRVDQLNRDRQQTWRLPRLNELATLVDRHCRLPRLDSHLFPNTPVARYWSATLVNGERDAAYSLDFGSEGVARTSLQDILHIRLVTGRE